LLDAARRVRAGMGPAVARPVRLGQGVQPAARLKPRRDYERTDMKITGIEPFVVSNGFTPPRPWHFCALRTDAGLTGYSVYWSHLATYRANNWKLLGVKPLKTLQDLADAAREAPARGYTAFKTNIIWPGEPARAISQGRLGPHDQVASRDIVKQSVAQIAAMRDAVGPDVGICLDINVNFKP